MYNDIYQAQRALVQHLKDGKDANAFACKTIKEFAGELASETLLQQVTPGLLVRLFDGPATGELPREHHFYIIITTKTTGYDKDKNLNNNLSLASKVGIYLDDNAAWSFNDTISGEAVEYLIMRDKTMSKILFQDNAYTCILMDIYFKILI